MGSTAPIKKKYNKEWYPVGDIKKRRGPMPPQIMLVLKWVLGNEQVKPLVASLVQIPGM